MQVDLLRAASPATRLSRAFGLSATIIALAKRALARSRPSAPQSELDIWFVALHYGADLAQDLRAYLGRHPRAPE